MEEMQLDIKAENQTCYWQLHLVTSLVHSDIEAANVSFQIVIYCFLFMTCYDCLSKATPLWKHYPLHGAATDVNNELLCELKTQV